MKSHHLSHASMLLVQLGASGYHVLSKRALQGGVNKYAFCLARDALATAFLWVVLLATTWVQSRGLPSPPPRKLWPSILSLGATGVCANQVLFLAGLDATSPSTAAAMQPSVPVLTFGLALATGAEKVDVRRRSGLARVGGVAVVVAGALVSALGGGGGVESAHAAGCFLLIGNCSIMAVYFTLQERVLREYGHPLALTSWSYLAGTLLLGLLCLVVMGEFRIGGGIVLLAAVYAGCIASGANYLIMTYANQWLGPTATALYLPLQPVLSSGLAYFFLGLPVAPSTLVGGLFILAGLYAVALSRADPSKLPD